MTRELTKDYSPPHHHPSFLQHTKYFGRLCGCGLLGALRRYIALTGIPVYPPATNAALPGYVKTATPRSSVRWRPPLWEYPSTEVLDFSNLLVPTMDSTRALFLLRMLHKQRKAVLMVGAEGTAKTSTALMFFTELDPVKTAVKRYVLLIDAYVSWPVAPRESQPFQSATIPLQYAGVSDRPYFAIPTGRKSTKIFSGRPSYRAASDAVRVN